MILKKLFWWVPFGSVPEITSEDLNGKRISAQTPYILDVRTPGEWETSRIEGSVNIPITSLKHEMKKLDIPAETPMVTICLTAHRSIPAVRLLSLAGFSDVRQLKGGMQAWWKAGLPVVEGKGK
jgi:rhodanese-related sulfurtransferase